MAVQSSGRARKFHLFNCDKTCNPSQVESLLRAVDDNVDFKIEMVIQQFCKHEMNTLVKRIPELKMDYGVLIIHANDSLLFEENSYGELCKSMTQNSRSGRINLQMLLKLGLIEEKRGGGWGKLLPDARKALTKMPHEELA